MSLIDGKQLALEIRERLATAVAQLEGRKPGLAVILVGQDPASMAYVQTKRRACQAAGIRSVDIELPAEASEEELLGQIDKLNADETIDGILIQLPLPLHIRSGEVLLRIDPTKDVDGFHPSNVGRLLVGDDGGFIPCTPFGIHEILVHYNVHPEGKHVVVVGRSNVVGKPIAALLMQERPTCNATVTIAHTFTPNLAEICRLADILIVAIGSPGFITPEFVREGAVVIDVGINRVADPNSAKGYRLVGDVDTEAVKEKASLITPVPGGVGPMTVAMLLHNTWTSYCRRMGA